jgi:hypothetical protein
MVTCQSVKINQVPQGDGPNRGRLLLFYTATIAAGAVSSVQGRKVKIFS